MGINRFYSWIEDKCPKAKNRLSLDVLRDKIIAVDVSILLYRFKKQRQLIPKMFLFCNLLRRYNIIPIFIFDGIPDKSKLHTIIKRNETKQEYYKKYIELKKQIDLMNVDVYVDVDVDVDVHDPKKNIYLKEKQEKEKELQYLYGQSIYIEKDEIENVKYMLDLYGMNWVVAKGEADYYCSDLMKNNQVYGVLSDDSDMFALGCKRIFRFLDVLNHTIVMYDLDELCRELDMDNESFKWLCTISRNDYRPESSNDTIDELYNQLLCLPKEWRHDNENENENENIRLNGIIENEHANENQYQTSNKVSNKSFNKRRLMHYMETYGFIH